MEKIIINYTAEDKAFTAEGMKSAHFNIEVEKSDGRTTMILNAEKPVRIQKFQIVLPYKYESNQRVFVNGYQSWTDSREYFLDEEDRKSVV